MTDIERDAQRWQWVRRQHESTLEDIFWAKQPMSPEALDALVDEYMQREEAE